MKTNMKNETVRMGECCGFKISKHCVGSPAEYWMAKRGTTVFTRKIWSDLKKHLEVWSGK